MTTSEESATFDAVAQKMMSVSHDEIKRREKGWKRKRQRAQQRKASAQGKRK